MATVNGDDQNNTLIGTGVDDQINGFGGNDLLDGGAGIDTLYGEAGDDVLVSRNNQGPDALDGGDGIDSAAIDRSSSTVALRVNLTDPTVLQHLGDGTTIINVEQFGAF